MGKGPKVVIWQTASGRWYFHKRNANGKITEPSQGYAHKRTAIHAAKRDIPGVDIIFAVNVWNVAVE